MKGVCEPAVQWGTNALLEIGRTPRGSSVRARVPLVEIIRDPDAAKLISDPMRRAILNLLRQRSLTEAGLAENLGLTDATVNYHLRLLKQAGVVTIAKREEEEHGIMQKFYAPSAYLFLPDVAALPMEVSRYFYPINIERARGVLSALEGHGGIAGPDGREVDRLGEDLAMALVAVARRYVAKTVEQGEGEVLVGRIYEEALAKLRRRLPP